MARRTDDRTDRQTEFSSLDRVCILQRGKMRDTTLNMGHAQWLKCNGTPLPHLQFMAQSVPPPQIITVSERHTTIVRGPNLNVAFRHL